MGKIGEDTVDSRMPVEAKLRIAPLIEANS